MSLEELDVRGLLCPLPVIRTQQRVNQLHPGQQLEVICSDPGALIDIPAWCRLFGHRVINAGSEARGQVVRLEVNPGAPSSNGHPGTLPD